MFAAERLPLHGWVPPWVRREHVARYAFAARHVKGKSVIDCACGEGAGAAAFAEAGARSVEAVDCSEPAIAAARRRWPFAQIRFLVGDGLRLPLPDRSADVYVALETIEHLRDDRAFLREAARVLQPDGLFICSSPNRDVTNPRRSLTDRPWNPFHVREYSSKEFFDLLRAEFGRVERYGQHPIHPRVLRVVGGVGRVLPGGGVRLRQMLKLPRLLCDRLSDHDVLPMQPGRTYEYLVALCARPSDRGELVERPPRG